MNEQGHRHSYYFDAYEHPDAEGHGASPGKVPTTVRLAGRHQTNIVFRVANEAAAAALGDAFGPRDSNGVAADASDAVDQANASTGHALPDNLRTRFEASLGADLSAVRIHTGTESVEASKALGARAYTTGRDIHFNEGQYNPIDPFGVHLLAHEVAHTVQQSSATTSSSQPQAKLEVSTPGDSFELEADRAADAMVAGQPATVSHQGVSHGTASAGRLVARKPINTRTNIEKDGDAGAKDPSKLGGLGASTTAEQVKVHGKSQAESLRNNIQSWQGRVGENASAKTNYSANQQAIGKLDVFIDASSVSETAVSGFKALFANSQAEYGRLMAMANSEALANVVNKDPAIQDGDWLADDHAVRASGGEDNAKSLGERAEQLANSTGPNGGENKEIKGALAKVKQSEKKVQGAATAVANSATKVTATQTGLNGAHATLQSVKSRAKAKEIQAAYDQAKAAYDAQVKSLEEAFKIIDKVKDIASAIGNPEKLAEEGVKLGWEAFKEIGMLVLGPEKPDPSEEEKAQRIDDQADIDAFNGALQTFNGKGKEVASTLSSLAEAVGNMQLAKEEHALNLKTLGQEFDKNDPKQKGKKRKDGEAGTYETIGVFIGQADAFLTSAEAAKQIGERDLTLDGHGAGTSQVTAESAAKTQFDARTAAVTMTAYRIEDRRVTRYENSPHNTGGTGMGSTGGREITVIEAFLVAVPIEIDSPHELPNGASGPVDVSAIDINVALDDLDEYMKQIREYKTKLSGAMGLS